MSTPQPPSSLPTPSTGPTTHLPGWWEERASVRKKAQLSVDNLTTYICFGREGLATDSPFTAGLPPTRYCWPGAPGDPDPATAESLTEDQLVAWVWVQITKCMTHHGMAIRVPNWDGVTSAFRSGQYSREMLIVRVQSMVSHWPTIAFLCRTAQHFPPLGVRLCDNRDISTQLDFIQRLSPQETQTLGHLVQQAATYEASLRARLRCVI